MCITNAEHLHDMYSTLSPVNMGAHPCTNKLHTVYSYEWPIVSEASYHFQFCIRGGWARRTMTECDDTMHKVIISRADRLISSYASLWFQCRYIDWSQEVTSLAPKVLIVGWLFCKHSIIRIICSKYWGPAKKSTYMLMWLAFPRAYLWLNFEAGIAYLDWGQSTLCIFLAASLDFRQIITLHSQIMFILSKTKRSHLSKISCQEE